MNYIVSCKKECVCVFVCNRVLRCSLGYLQLKILLPSLLKAGITDVY
jgi:hypothetical protein